MTTPLRKAAEALADATHRLIGTIELEDRGSEAGRATAAVKALRAALAQPDDPWATRRRAAWEDGWRAATEHAAKQVERHCDCTHADVPGIIRLALTTDPIYGMPPETPDAAPSQQTGGGCGCLCHVCLAWCVDCQDNHAPPSTPPQGNDDSKET